MTTPSERQDNPETSLMSAASSPAMQRLAAFAQTPGGGNPAGVSIGRVLPTEVVMQRVAADAGYSETAFVAPLGGRAYRVRYFSPVAEVQFCGHATIACGVALAQQDGDGVFELHTNGGVVSVRTSLIGERASATLTSLPARVAPASKALIARALRTLHWKSEELDVALPPAMAFAGEWHLILCVSRRDRLARLDYDFEPLRTLMLEHRLTTLQLVWRETANLFHVRDPFPVGGIVEDPATGAAAAAFGVYLRDLHGWNAPARATLLQGQDMGRPSRLDVELVPDEAGIRVTGRVIPIDA